MRHQLALPRRSMLEMLAELHGREGGRKKNPAAAVLNVRRTTGD
jgi:hypothetical protein